MIKDQLKEHIIEEVDRDDQFHYFMHQGVIKTDAETTRLSVVFDSSAKLGKHSHLLNDCLHIGSSLRPLMYDVSLRFRVHKVVVIRNTRKAFLQIKVTQVIEAV